MRHFLLLAFVITQEAPTQVSRTIAVPSATVTVSPTIISSTTTVSESSTAIVSSSITVAESTGTSTATPTSTPGSTSGTSGFVSNPLWIGIIVVSVIVICAIGLWAFRKLNLAPSNDFKNRLNPIPRPDNESISTGITQNYPQPQYATYETTVEYVQQGPSIPSQQQYHYSKNPQYATYETYENKPSKSYQPPNTFKRF